VHERLEHSTEPDPADALDGLVDELDAEQLRDAAELGLRHVAQEIVRRERSNALTGRAAGASVYDRAAELVQAHPDVFGLRVCVGARAWRFLGDCDRDDLEHAEQDARRRGAELLGRAEVYARLRAKLRGRRRVVADLGVDTVREVLAA
jgi:hypothetical protein